MLSALPITTLGQLLQSDYSFDMGSLGIAEFGINISKIAKRTRDMGTHQVLREREESFVKWAFLKRCREEGFCRSFVSKNFPYPYPNQYKQVNVYKAVSTTPLLFQCYYLKVVKK